jgi:hypothetical protein
MSERFQSDVKNTVTVDLSKIVERGFTEGTLIKINKKLVREGAADQLAVAVAQRSAQGVKNDRITRELVKRGMPQEQAVNMVGEISLGVENFKRSPQGRIVLKRKYRNQMAWGGLGIVVGIAITIGTFQLASPTGGQFIIMYGPVVFGLGAFITGLIGWLKYRNPE